MLLPGSAWPCNRSSGVATAHLALQLLIWKRLKRQTKINDVPLCPQFHLPVRAERHGHALQITIWEHEHGKYCGSAPQPARLQQAHSIGRGPAYLENMKRTLNKWWASLPSISFCQWGQRDMNMHYKKPIDFNCFNVNKLYYQNMNMENIVGQPINLVVRNRAYSAGKKKKKKRLILNIVCWIFSQLVWNRPSSSGKAPAHLEKSKRED